MHTFFVHSFCSLPFSIHRVHSVRVRSTIFLRCWLIKCVHRIGVYVLLPLWLLLLLLLLQLLLSSSLYFAIISTATKHKVP